MTVARTGESALRRIADPRGHAATVRRALEGFLAGAAEADEAIRPLISESWRRSRGSGVNPAGEQAPVALSGAELQAARAASPLAAVMPTVRSLLADPAVDAGHVVAVGDVAGRLLWVEGDGALRGQVESMGFAEGALWSEEVAGTNAPGTALALDEPVQIFATEHYMGVAHTWSCAAVPVHDPHSGRTIGVIDVTGDDGVAGPHALGLVRATAAAVEAELRLLPPSAAHGPAPWRLEFLGHNNAVLFREGQRTVLSTRHSELVLLLAMNPAGLTADRIAVLLHEHDVPAVTVRAEMTRLRRVLGRNALSSRPYRLEVDLEVDVLRVASALDSGRLTEAVGAYTGALIPSSEAPAVADLRESLRARIRRAALGSRDSQVLLSFAATDAGADDVEVLRAALAALPADSPLRSDVEARLEHLDLVYG